MIVKSVTVELDEHYFQWLKSARGDATTYSEVVMVLPRQYGKVLALTKSFYPVGTYSLPSGGIEPGETPELTFCREVAEETSLDVHLEDQIGRIEHMCVLGNEGLCFVSHVMLGAESDTPPSSHDADEQISAYVDASASDLFGFAERMRTLTGKWTGFGRFRATALDFVAEWLLQTQREVNE